MTSHQQEKSDTFNNEAMAKLHDKLSSIAWSQYSTNLVDYGVKKVVSIKELLACQDMVTPVCQVLESQNVSRKDVFEFLEQELTIYMTSDRTIRIHFPVIGGNYALLFRTMEQAKQKTTDTTQNTPQTENGKADSKDSSSNPESVKRPVNVTEMFLGNQIPLNADNFSIRINFGEFLKQTNRFNYLHHKLNQERRILKDKLDLIYFNAPIYLSIVLSDHNKLDDEQERVITYKNVHVNFMYEQSSEGGGIVKVLKSMDFRMFKMNEYNRNEMLAQLTRFLEDTTSIVTSIVSHWNYAYQRLLVSQPKKDEAVKQAIEHYLNTRCYESKMQIGNLRGIIETHVNYLFDTAKFVEYFNQLHGKNFKLKDIKSKKLSVVFCSREPSEAWYLIHDGGGTPGSYTVNINNVKDLLDALANFVL